ncbi:hypothetical protein [Acinetobacter silvestris]|uniref:Uncharacterized protein n=1 Tax=Acinetobacter silvestris TaxID=1977882 RepID=A0A1Y3CGU8_9GAMM|nr:hypothetical protein [Acinetobacter silvestris]OTG65842.1 hypothetical protein B9T28_06480 [Acinetobacter silvestris]
MSSEQLKAFITKERNAGTSDIQIFNKMLDTPAFKKGIEKGNSHGLSNRSIAEGIGLKLPERKAVDLEDTKRQGTLAEAKKEGKTKAWESVLLGSSDLGAGVLQGINYAADGLSGAINKATGTNLDTKSYDRFTKQRKDIEDFHNASREANDQGFDWARLGGQIASTAPMAALGRGYQGAKVLSAAGAKVASQNALVGAGIGGASFAKDADQRIANTALGAVGGAGGAAIGEKIGQGVVKVAQGVKNQSAKLSIERTNEILRSIDSKLDGALQQSGMRLSELSDEVANGLRTEAKKALLSGKVLNAEAVARKAALDQVGIKGTRAQVTGNAKQWQQEAELAKLQGAGDDLREKLVSDNTKLVDLLETEAQKTGGRSIDNYGVGRDSAESLMGQYKQNKQFVREAYAAAKNANGNDVLINGQGFSNDVFTALDDKALASFLPADIRNIVKQINDNPSYFTLRKGEELIKVLNGHYKTSMQMGEPTATTNALGVVRQALQTRQDEALQGLLSNGGNDAAQAYSFAREAYKANSSLKAQIPMLQDVLKQQSKGSVNYDDLYKKHILNGKIEELGQTFDVLKNTNPQAIADIQQEVIKDISAKAINSNGKFSPAGMKNALDALGDRKLNVIFSSDQVKRLKDIRQAADYSITQPPHSYVNNSNSGSALYNHFMSLLKLPGARVLLSSVKDIPDSMAVSKAMKPTIAGEAMPSQGNQDLIDRLTRAGLITGSNLPKQ